MQNLSTEYLAPSEAAREAGCSREWIHKLIRTGRLEAVRTPIGHLIRRDSVAAHMASRDAKTR